jgi:hypothetical protein
VFTGLEALRASNVTALNVFMAALDTSRQIVDTPHGKASLHRAVTLLTLDASAAGFAEDAWAEAMAAAAEGGAGSKGLDTLLVKHWAELNAARVAATDAAGAGPLAHQRAINPAAWVARVRHKVLLPAASPIEAGRTDKVVPTVATVCTLSDRVAAARWRRGAGRWLSWPLTAILPPMAVASLATVAAIGLVACCLTAGRGGDSEPPYAVHANAHGLPAEPTTRAGSAMRGTRPSLARRAVAAREEEDSDSAGGSDDEDADASEQERVPEPGPRQRKRAGTGNSPPLRQITPPKPGRARGGAPVGQAGPQAGARTTAAAATRGRRRSSTASMEARAATAAADERKRTPSGHHTRSATHPSRS